MTARKDYSSMTLALLTFGFCMLLLWNSLLDLDSWNQRQTRTQENRPEAILQKTVISRGLSSFHLLNNNSSSLPLEGRTFLSNGTSPEVFNDSKPEVRHIGFLKVHKAASSTMQNIFYRFGLKRELTFVFTTHPNYFSRNAEMHIPVVPPRHRKQYDILCNHAVFDYPTFTSFLPSDAVYLAIVRDPLEVFISAVNYYSQKAQKIDSIYNITGNKLQKLIRYPKKYDPGFFSYTKNVMARDFGFPETKNFEQVQEKLKELDRVFRLVLIVEYLEESLVLMKRYLNWKLQDILFISSNVLGNERYKLTIANLTNEDLSKFKDRNILDYIVYNHFHKRFWTQFLAESDDIYSEVLHFKEVLQLSLTFCTNVAPKSDLSILVVPESKWNENFSVTGEDCDYMMMKELDFIDILRHEQGSEIWGMWQNTLLGAMSKTGNKVLSKGVKTIYPGALSKNAAIKFTNTGNTPLNVGGNAYFAKERVHSSANGGIGKSDLRPNNFRVKTVNGLLRRYNSIA